MLFPLGIPFVMRFVGFASLSNFSPTSAPLRLCGDFLPSTKNAHTRFMREVNHFKRPRRENMAKAASIDRSHPAFSHLNPHANHFFPLPAHLLPASTQTGLQPTTPRLPYSIISHPFCVLCVLLRPILFPSVPLCLCVSVLISASHQP